MGRYGEHEQVVFFSDPKVQLKGIIAIHNTNLGPALGGCRMWPYTSEQAALKDVLKLSRGMTYKAAISNLALGGGKAVIIGNSKQKNPQLFSTFGRFVESLNGRYITAEDVGTSVDDMKYIREKTSYVAGLPTNLGGAGDPSPYTARSTLVGMKAAVWHKFKKKSLKGLHIAIQGMGHVGLYLAQYLLEEGCKLTICDCFEQKAYAFKEKYPEVEVVHHDKIYEVECDIFAPCALGAVLTPLTVSRLKCSVIAGAANNQLDTIETENLIRQKDILYAPDFVINAGGLIHVSVEAACKGGSYKEEETFRRIDKIHDTLVEIFCMADSGKNTNTTDRAIKIAEQKILQKKDEIS